jgi:hypothetical protein
MVVSAQDAFAPYLEAWRARFAAAAAGRARLVAAAREAALRSARRLRARGAPPVNL